MKLRKCTIWAAAVGLAACTAVANADKLPKPAAVKPAAPVVQLPADAKRIVIPTPLGGPTVALPVREGVDLANTTPATPMAMSTGAAAVPVAPVPRRVPATAPKVVLPVDSNVPRVPTKEAGPLVPLPQ